MTQTFTSTHDHIIHYNTVSKIQPVLTRVRYLETNDTAGAHTMIKRPSRSPFQPDQTSNNSASLAYSDSTLKIDIQPSVLSYFGHS